MYLLKIVHLFSHVHTSVTVTALSVGAPVGALSPRPKQSLSSSGWMPQSLCRFLFYLFHIGATFLVEDFFSSRETQKPVLGIR